MNYYDKYIADTARDLVNLRLSGETDRARKAFVKLMWLVNAEKNNINPETYKPAN